MDAPYLFYGTRVSFFSAKVRCALRAKGLPFRELEPSQEVYREVTLRVAKRGFQLVYSAA